MFWISGNVLIVDVFGWLLVSCNNRDGGSLWGRINNEWFDLLGSNGGILLNESVNGCCCFTVGLFNQIDLVWNNNVLIVDRSLGEDSWLNISCYGWNGNSVGSIGWTVKDADNLLFSFGWFNHNTVLTDCSIIGLNLCRYNSWSLDFAWSDNSLKTNITFDGASDQILRNNNSGNDRYWIGCCCNGYICSR